MTAGDIQSMLEKLQKPSSYLGNETNAIIKEPEKVKLRFALVFPDLYEIGTSHFGIQILYHILNSHPEIYAERVYAPARDLMALMEQGGYELTSLETKTPLKNFDIIGFSLLYELNYTNILHILRLSKLPYKFSERKTTRPFIIAGGPCTCNPEPLAPFFDAFVIGDGEKVVLDLAMAFIDWKKKGAKHKKELLARWAWSDGVYVPRFYKVHYEQGRQLLEAEKGFPEKIKRAVVPLLDDSNFPDSPIVPYGRPVHDRLRLEISRGCTRGCRFCQAGVIYRPVRERNPGQLLNLAVKAIEKTGYQDVSLLSLSTGDYGCLFEIVKDLIELGKKKHLAVSLPSIRAGTLSGEMMELIRQVRKTGFTIAPEAGSQRLRDVINKNVDYDDVRQTVEQAFELGWQVIKLYFMVGLPTETDEDIHELIEMVRRLKKCTPSHGRGGKINVSVATFIPKPHTPFQWHRQITLAESVAKIKLIRKELKTNRIQVKWQQPEMSVLEGLWARGDRRLSGLLIEAARRGCAFDGWSDDFDFEKWQESITSSGIDPAFYMERRRDLDEPLPWDHVDVGISKDFLKAEWVNSLSGNRTPDCRWDGCQKCGVCDFDKIKPVLYGKVPDAGILAGVTEKDAGRKRWLLFRFRKAGLARFLGHLEMSQVFIRAFRRAAVDLVYGGGFHPLPKMIFADALPLGMESHDEVGYAMVESAKKAAGIGMEVNRQLPEGLEIMECEEIESPKKIKIEAFSYRISLDQRLVDPQRLVAFQTAPKWPLPKRTKKGFKRIVDLKESVIDIAIAGPSTIVMTISNKQGKRVRPAEALMSILDVPDAGREKMKIVKTASIMN